MEGETLQMTATVEPDNATNKEVEWSVYDIIGDEGTVTAPSVRASIDSEGKLTGIYHGMVRVIATATDGSGTTGSKDIEVIINYGNPPNGNSGSGGTNNVPINNVLYTLSDHTGSPVESGGEASVKADSRILLRVYDSNAKPVEATWTKKSWNGPGVGPTIEIETGLVVASKDTGTMIVRASAEGYDPLEMIVNVVEDGEDFFPLLGIVIEMPDSQNTLATNWTGTLSFLYAPDFATIPVVRWSITDENYGENTTASINPLTGELYTGNNPTTIVVTARALDGTPWSDSCTITVE